MLFSVHLTSASGGCSGASARGGWDPALLEAGSGPLSSSGGGAWKERSAGSSFSVGGADVEEVLLHFPAGSGDARGKVTEQQLHAGKARACGSRRSCRGRGADSRLEPREGSSPARTAASHVRRRDGEEASPAHGREACR